MTKAFNFTIGADPEFVCLDQFGKIIHASDVVDDDDETPSEFGHDGCESVFEVRPSPHVNPPTVINRIRNIFLNSIRLHPELLQYRWTAGSVVNGHPIGGHIHFGISDYTNNYQYIVSILDVYLGLPLLLLEKVNEAKNRRKKSYGKKGDFRDPDYGLEYRTPSSWLVSPQIAVAALCLAKTIVYEYLNTNFHSVITINSINKTDFNQVYRNKLKKIFYSVWPHITRMQLYPKYQSYINLIYFLILHNRTWHPYGDLKQTWGLVDSSLENRLISMRCIWSDFIKSRQSV